MKVIIILQLEIYLLALIHIDDYDNPNSIIKLLIRSSAELNYKDEEGCTLFLRFC